MAHPDEKKMTEEKEQEEDEDDEEEEEKEEKGKHGDSEEDEDDSEYDSDSSVPMDPELKSIIKDLDSEAVHPDDLPQQADPRCRKMKIIFQGWAAESSCHGVPHMAEAHSLLVIFVWSTILLIALLAFTYLFYITMVQYLAYAKAVNLKMALNDMDFPAVTICNINPYKLSKISAVPQLQALLLVYSKAAEGQSINA